MDGTYTTDTSSSSSSSSSPRLLPPIETDDRKIVRKIERDPWNRLRSIKEDAQWVSNVSRCIPHAPLVPNLRCGAWYVYPDVKGNTNNDEDNETFCYFKSTDGHADQWSFSLKRPNLAVASLLQRHGSVIVVDSTRRGKSLPDALSKTIPAWCAVLTEASLRRYGTPASHSAVDSSSVEPFRPVHHTGKSLYTPSHQVPASEHSQMHDRIDGWVDSLLSSDLPIPKLSKAVVPFFLTRPSTDKEEQDLLEALSAYSRPDVYCVILLSASRRVDSPLPRLDYYYTQGSGDDEEIWSCGLTPEMFWEQENNHQRIMQSARQDLSDVIKDIVGEQHRQSGANRSKGYPRQHRSMADRQVAGSIFHLGERGNRHSEEDAQQYSLVIHCDGEERPLGDPSEPPRDIYLTISSTSKKAGPIFRSALPGAIEAVETAVDVHRDSPRDAPLRILIVDTKMAGQVSVAMATALLSCFYASPHEDSGLVRSAVGRAEHRQRLTKDDIRRRLQWIASDFPGANPSRELMVKINQVLLSRPPQNS